MRKIMSISYVISKRLKQISLYVCSFDNVYFLVVWLWIGDSFFFKDAEVSLYFNAFRFYVYKLYTVHPVLNQCTLSTTFNIVATSALTITGKEIGPIRVLLSRSHWMHAWMWTQSIGMYLVGNISWLPSLGQGLQGDRYLHNTVTHI